MKSLQLQVFDNMKFPKTLGKLPKDIYTDREYAMVELWRAFREDGVTFRKESKVYQIRDKKGALVYSENRSVYHNSLPYGKTSKELLSYVEKAISGRIKSIVFVEDAKGNFNNSAYKIVFNNNSGMTLNPYNLADIAYQIEGDEAIKPIKKVVENPNEISPRNTEFMALMGQFTNKLKNDDSNFVLFSENQVTAWDGPTLVNFYHQNTESDIGLYTFERNAWQHYTDKQKIEKAKVLAENVDSYTLKRELNNTETQSFEINRKALVDTLKQISKVFKNKEFSEKNFGGIPDIYLEMYPDKYSPKKSKLIMTVSNSDYGHLIEFNLSCFYYGKAFIKVINPLLFLKAINTFKSENENITIVLNDSKTALIKCFAIHDECKYGKFETVVMLIKEGRNPKRREEKDKDGKVTVYPSDYLDIYLPKKEAIAKFNENYKPVEIDEKVRLIALKYKYAALAQQQELELLSL